MDFQRPMEESLGEQADHYDEMLRSNDASLRANGRYLKWAMTFFGASPFLAVMAYVAVAVWVSEEVTAAVPGPAEVEKMPHPYVPAEASEVVPKPAASNPSSQ